MAQPSIESAQHAIGYVFQDQRWLDEALTHKSHVNEIKQKPRKHNERLEFLGDAVLALVVSERLLAMFPDFAEGELSKLKARLVSEASLAKVARRVGLGSLLRLGRGEELTQGREKSSLLANVMEAVVAAIYVDGGLDASRQFILRAFLEEFQELQDGGGLGVLEDYKTQLQEWCQKKYETLPQYAVIREAGPDHQKTFDVHVSVRGEILGLGSGRSKKEAEQLAAKQALMDAVR